MAQDTQIVLKLADGLEILPELKKLSMERDEKVLAVTSCRGKIKEFELMYQNRDGRTVKNFFREPHKLVHTSGALEKNESDSQVTLNVSVSKDGFVTTAGKLLSGKAAGDLSLEFKGVENIKSIRTW
ncbi:MAG: DUF296 domain-containing protein [Candidatus Micrarchaeota archaeon]